MSDEMDLDDEDVEQEMFALPFMIEVYLRERPDPLYWPMNVFISQNVTDVKQAVDFAHGMLSAIWDSRSTDHILIVDDKYNHHMVKREEIQALSILAPTDGLPWEEENNEG